VTGGARLLRRLAPGLLAAAALAACGSERGPEWLDLARLSPELPPPLGPAAGETRVEAEGEDLWLVAPIPRAAWRAEGPGHFVTTLPVLAVGSPAAGGPHYRLRFGERALVYAADTDGAEPGRFTTRASEGLRLEVALAPDEEPPERAELWAVLAYQTRAEDVWRVGGRRLSGAGLWVPAGQPRTLEVRLPPEARLSFATSIEPLYGARELRQAEHVFRVRLDGALVFEERVTPDVLGESLRWHALELPRGGVQKARLELEVEGPLALSAFLAPSVGPSAFGTYGARPFARDPARRDVVVFLADTFRADNLSAYGSPLELTPEIDRFAADARVFAHAYAPSTHTLGSHSAMFSGVFPHQNGQVDFFNPLPEAVRTLAEVLATRGYRCGLISDGVMVSHAHGLDQGFALFDERRESGTLERARAFLDADDGRPAFLFVQTYAAHTPYQMSAETRARWNGPLKLDRTYDEVMATELMRSEEPLPVEAPPEDPEVRAIAARLRDLYRAGITQLDTLFGRFHAELGARGFLEQGCLVFTSDHGEAFFEHGVPFHANRVFEEELRVPLILKVPGLPAGREERRVSLIDFAPTLAELTGGPPLPHWRGRSLLHPADGRTIFAFQANRGRPGSTLAVIADGRKWMGYDDLEDVRAGRAHAAFDLERDPGEVESLLGSADWPEAMARAYRAELEELLTPLVTQERSNLTPEQLRTMGAMGYIAGDDDEH